MPLSSLCSTLFSPRTVFRLLILLLLSDLHTHIHAVHSWLFSLLILCLLCCLFRVCFLELCSELAVSPFSVFALLCACFKSLCFYSLHVCFFVALRYPVFIFFFVFQRPNLYIFSPVFDVDSSFLTSRRNCGWYERKRDILVQ